MRVKIVRCIGCIWYDDKVKPEDIKCGARFINDSNQLFVINHSPLHGFLLGGLNNNEHMLWLHGRLNMNIKVADYLNKLGAVKHDA